MWLTSIYSGTSVANPKSLEPEGVQIISEVFGLVKCIMVLMKHFVVSNY